MMSMTETNLPGEPGPTERALALAAIERRINEARAVVFANDDGVVTKSMTDLEREWRELARAVARDRQAALPSSTTPRPTHGTE
jgi:ribosomal protein L10